ncbi:MAG TPA: response regulator [Cytophagales bacterium]|nr:response regulator [Cytophagales bacterium]
MNFKIPNILLVEDDLLDVINVQRTLAKINLTHKLFVAKNGEEALAMIKGDSSVKINPLPDIILLDINMPKMDGLEFLSILRAHEEFKDIKVFIITTSNEDLDKESSQKLGVSGYIVKPLSLNSGKDNFSLLIDLMNLKSA